jgi:S1-C subfamily serine protease
MKPLRLAFALAFLLGTGQTARLAAQELSQVEVYDKCVKSSVFIVTPIKGGMAMGSGSLIDAQKRYVLTNYHVVGDSDMVYVQFPVRQKDGSLMTDKKSYISRIPAGQALRGKVLFRDKSRDLSIVQLDRLPPDTPAMKLAKTSPRVGEALINIGNPGKVNQTFSMGRGEVRGVGMEDMVVHGDDEVLRIKAKMVTVSIPTNPGDSGGPVIDSRGYQVAVTESGYSGAAAQAVNSCVDITEVRAFLSEKKIVLPNDGPEEKVATRPKHGLDSDRHKIDPQPGKTPPSGTPPAPKVDAVPVAVPAPGAASPEDEKTASAMLQRAKVFKDDEDRTYYKTKLKDIVAKYPTTTAGKEAKKLLDGLQ